MMPDMIIIKTAGKTEIHATHYNGNYATLCGVDGNDNDPSVDQQTVGYAPKGSRVNCKECKDIITHASIYRAGVIAKGR